MLCDFDIPSLRHPMSSLGQPGGVAPLEEYLAPSMKMPEADPATVEMSAGIGSMAAQSRRTFLESELAACEASIARLRQVQSELRGQLRSLDQAVAERTGEALALLKLAYEKQKLIVRDAIAQARDAAGALPEGKDKATVVELFRSWSDFQWPSLWEDARRGEGHADLPAEHRRALQLHAQMLTEINTQAQQRQKIDSLEATASHDVVACV